MQYSITTNKIGTSMVSTSTRVAKTPVGLIVAMRID